MSAQKVGVVDEAALQRVAASTAKERMYAWHVLSSHVILHCSSNPSLLSLSVRLRRDELFLHDVPKVRLAVDGLTSSLTLNQSLVNATKALFPDQMDRDVRKSPGLAGFDQNDSTAALIRQLRAMRSELSPTPFAGWALTIDEAIARISADADQTFAGAHVAAAESGLRAGNRISPIDALKLCKQTVDRFRLHETRSRLHGSPAAMEYLANLRHQEGAAANYDSALDSRLDEGEGLDDFIATERAAAASAVYTGAARPTQSLPTVEVAEACRACALALG